MNDLQATIGLETHVQLNTKTKIWCGCPVDPHADPNTCCCPVCLGYPGSLPVLNAEAVRKTVQAGLLLNCEIGLHSKHDRKSYFYPDMPKNYQITQYDQPLCIGGELEVEVNGKSKKVRLNRIHLEEDVGKSTHLRGSSGIDYNRAGTPLMEIVTEPDLHSEDEAMAYLSALKQLLQYGGVSDCNLELGNIRCDVNISVAPKGSDTLGVKAEIKNMNSFRNVHRAIAYEVFRQKKAIAEGTPLVQETRGWDDGQGTTFSMRSKEDAHDYRYFPDPDLCSIVLNEEQVEEIKASLPERPREKRARYIQELGLPAADADVILAEQDVAEFFEAVLPHVQGEAKATANWVMTELMRVLTEKECRPADLPLTPEALAGLIKLVQGKTLNAPKAKEVFAELVEQGGDPKAIVEKRGLAQVSDDSAIDAFVQQVIEANPGPVADVQSGKMQAIQFLMGQVMKLSRGKANPKMVQERLKEMLAPE